MKLYEYLAKCVEEHDNAWAVAEVDKIQVTNWNRNSRVVDSIKFHPEPSSDEMLVFTICGHDIAKRYSHFRACWEVRPRLITRLKAECTCGESGMNDWIGECLIVTLLSAVH
jgi:hypothetical protein